MHARTGALSGASVQPRLATCGSRVVLVWRSLVSIKSSSRACQARMVQAHAPSPSFSPGLTGTHGTWRPSVPARYQAGTCVCCRAPGSRAHCSRGALSPAPSQHPWRGQTDRQRQILAGGAAAFRGAQGHTLVWEGSLEGGIEKSPSASGRGGTGWGHSSVTVTGICRGVNKDSPERGLNEPPAWPEQALGD